MSDQSSNLQVLLQRAVSAHGAGNLAEAEGLYRQILAKSPGQPTALYLLGVVALQVGRPDVAAELIEQALKGRPDNAEAHYNLGNAYQALGRDQDAEHCFREAIRLQPDYAQAHYNLGTLRKASGSLEAAEKSFRAAVGHAPGLGQAWCNLGVVLDELGRTLEAVEAYRTGLKATPNLAEGHNNLGNALTRLERGEEALGCYREALSVNPLFGAAYRNLGTTLQTAGAGADAKAPFRKAILLEPGDAENCYNLGTAMEGSGGESEWFRRALAIRPGYTAARYNLGTSYLAGLSFDQARRAFLEVVGQAPLHVQAWGNLGTVAQKLGELFLARSLYRKSLCLEPSQTGLLVNAITVQKDTLDLDGAMKLARGGLAIDPLSPMLLGALGLVWQARGDSRAEPLLRCAIIAAPDEVPQYLNLALALKENHKIQDAELPLRRARIIGPDEALVLGYLGLHLADATHFDEAFDLSTRAVERQPGNPDLHKMLLFFLHYIPELDSERFMAAYRRFDEEIGGPLRRHWRPHRNRRDQDKRIKLGYVGASYQRHSSTSFFLPLLRHHDHDRFEIYNYAFYSVRGDKFTEQMQALSDHWVPTFGIGDHDLAERIRTDEIDILVDLAGHTKGNRLAVFAEKPAPVSMHWLDHGVTTGLSAIDYFLGDPVFTPEGSGEWFSENVWNLPRLVFPYEPLDTDTEVAAAPALANGYVTFGIVSRSIRINENVIRLWSTILKQMPDTRIAVFSQSCRDPAVAEEFESRFAAFGVARERLNIGFCPKAADAHAQIDILLDCFPHNAGVTFYECVYMGLPAVTLRGNPAIGTLGSSMLTQLGHPEWIAETEEDYVRIACDLASNIERLALQRRNLRQEMERSPLMDGPAFARDFENACRAMWANWCASS
ncbi:tetratricopeptide repeat protein [Nisaea acidiphila]|uniref:protein O-GlcNAc transferase n=1 Tax=Nisaea acidiphila TaxID=1862145 RepID=A0A9J7ARS5_9PROT|nr:tetratricopeptide repeat protein [Nisaea acidiphila]UUX49028.1 tetratricopeptide repeat protein [Nisaea acidiphila]